MRGMLARASTSEETVPRSLADFLTEAAFELKLDLKQAANGQSYGLRRSIG